MIFKKKRKNGGKHDKARMPLHSGEPRAQHAPRGPDGCLLLSPRPPPHPITPLTDAASQSLHPTRIHPPPTDRCARARTHTRTLNHINDKLHAHDIWSLHAGLAWVSHLHAFFFYHMGPCCWGFKWNKERKKGTILTPPRMKPQPIQLSTLAGLPDMLASKLS